ncbi:hypothetical protein JCM9279_003470 [Rhodotorula babjevae]
MPALDRRQQVWPTTTTPAPTSSTADLAQTSATRFLPQATSSADSSSSGSDGSVSVWKYAIVVILCVFALGALVRLGLLHRLRRQRAVYTRDHQQQHRARPRPPPRTADSQRSLNGSIYSLDLEHAEPPPPGYDDEARPSSTSPAAAAAAVAPPPAPPPPPPPHGPFARLSSFFRRGNSDAAVPMQHLSATRSPASQQHQRSADPTTLAEVAHLRRALRDAGLLGPSSSSSGPRSFVDLTPSQRAALNGATPAVLVAAAAALAGPRHGVDDDVETESERRRAERVRRRAERRLRRRREREAQREAEEGLGLPTYSRKVADGEETLQRAEGWKTDGSDGDDGEDSGDSGDERERERGDAGGATLGGAGGAVVPTLDGAHPPRASTSSRTAAPSHERVVVVEGDAVQPVSSSASPPPAAPPPARSEL